MQFSGDYLKHVVLKYIEYCQKGDMKSQSHPWQNFVLISIIIYPFHLSLQQHANKCFSIKTLYIMINNVCNCIRCGFY